MADGAATAATAKTAGTRSRLVTFLFTDIEGSTRLLEQLGDAYADLLEEHWQVLRDAFGARGGTEFGAEGDAMFFAFTAADDALAAAIDAQRAILAHPWTGQPWRVRMGIHSGEARQAFGTWIGLSVHQTARTCSAGHGGQILVSQDAASLLERTRTDLALDDLGEFRLRDITAVQRIFQVRHPALPSSFPPLRTPSAEVTNLPNQLTTFVGRQQELVHLRRLLREHRLVTLAGPGGAGKTRLALEVAGAAGPDHPDGVWIVQLSMIDDPANVTTAALAALGVIDDDQDNSTSRLVGALGSRELVLVLDNCEHVVDAVAPMVERVLMETRSVRVIATTREPLGLPGEVVWRVPPLAASDATRLFLDRAAQARADVDFSTVALDVIDRLCARLDYAPLAIELAAARVASMSVDQIAARIDDRLRLLTTGSRTAEPRQRTLRAAIDWSHDLLDDDERIAFRRLAVFAGPFALDMAEVVIDRGAQGIDLVDSLVRKSLVTAEPTERGEYRYRLLETMREYAHERLVEAEESASARESLVDAVLAVTREMATQFSGPNQVAALDRLDAELPNLRAALDWAVTVRPADALRLAGLLGQFFGVRGHLREGRTWLARALQVASLKPDVDSIRALVAAGTLARLQGDLVDARAHHERQLAIAREMKNDAEVARAVNALGTVLLAADDVRGARPLLQESLAIRRRLGDQRGIALSLNNLGALADMEGDFEAARRYYEEHLAIMQELGDTRVVGQSMHNLGEIAMTLGDLPEARRLLEGAHARLIEVGDTRSISLTTSLLGALARAEGNIAEAIAFHKASLPVAAELEDPVIVRSNLESIAAVLAMRGSHENALNAARLLGAGASLAVGRAERGDADIRSRDEAAQRARNVVGDTAFDAAHTEGAALTFEAAVALALFILEALGGATG